MPQFRTFMVRSLRYLLWLAIMPSHAGFPAENTHTIPLEEKRIYHNRSPNELKEFLILTVHDWRKNKGTLLDICCFLLAN